MAEISREEAWNKIFDSHPILEGVTKNGFYDLSNTSIKKFKEPRIMCKVDFRENLPKIMQSEGLSILAISNRSYRIAKNSPFVDINESISQNHEVVNFPSGFISLDPQVITSESAALDVAKISGMLDLVFGEETHLSIRGRKYCSLDFKIGNIEYPVNGVQVEVDGGYEGGKSINLIEAKIGGRNNINIRQLLYPQLYWQGLKNNNKKTSSYIFQFQNGLYRFIPFEYDGTECLVNHSRERVFKIAENVVNFDLMTIPLDLNLTDLEVPFPQADAFDKVIAMLIIIGEKNRSTKDEIGLEFDLVPRQIDYYSNVLRWMKLITLETDSKLLILTELGKKLFNMHHSQRMQHLAKIIFSNEIFFIKLHKPESEITETLRNKFQLNNQNLYSRRMTTVKSWINYFKKYFEIN